MFPDDRSCPERDAPTGDSLFLKAPIGGSQEGPTRHLTVDDNVNSSHFDPMIGPPKDHKIQAEINTYLDVVSTETKETILRFLKASLTPIPSTCTYHFPPRTSSQLYAALQLELGES